jgi:hypothetical protein
MHSTAILTVFATTLLGLVNAQTTTEPVTGTLGNATVVENNPPNAVYTATLPETQFFNPKDPRGNVKGTVSATANANGIGITINVKFSNLPTSGGPFRKFSLLQIFAFMTNTNQSTIFTTNQSPQMATALAPSAISIPTSAAR